MHKLLKLSSPALWFNSLETLSPLEYDHCVDTKCLQNYGFSLNSASTGPEDSGGGGCPPPSDGGGVWDC